MNFAPEGLVLMLAVTLVAAITYASALKLRSWPLWLAAFVLTLCALGVAWQARVPAARETRAAPAVSQLTGFPSLVPHG